MRKNITSGSKISDSHQSVIRHALPFLRELKKEHYVEKIVIGTIKNVPSKSTQLKSTNTGTSIKLVVKSRNGVQEFFVIGRNLRRIDQKIKQISKGN